MRIDPLTIRPDPSVFGMEVMWSVGVVLVL